MLIELLRQDPKISKFIRKQCSENDVEVSISPEIEDKNLLIIKIDAFYNEELGHPDFPSPDCLIVQRCTDHFDIYIVELKNVKSAKYISKDKILGKFISCLDDFMSNRFASYFYHDEVELNNLKLYFISDPYDFKKFPERQLTMKGHKFDLLNSIRIPKFFNKHLYIEPHIPNPTILKCA